MSITPENLPAYPSISHAGLRDAVAAVSAARSELNERKRDTVELEQTRPSSEWADAEASERARAEGKPEPKRSHVAEHDRKLDKARHEEKVATLALQRAEKQLDDAILAFGDEYKQEVAKELESLDKLWTAAVNTLTDLAPKRGQANTIGRTIGLERVQQGALGFNRRQIEGVEFGPQQGKAKGWIAVEDILASLAEHGFVQPEEPEPEQERVKPQRIPSPLEDMGAVQEEIAERNAYFAAIGLDAAA